jgi:hypothetical protein
MQQHPATTQEMQAGAIIIAWSATVRASKFSPFNSVVLFIRS